nr:T9SS type A sorting domain-containing protein [Saprospiraceae bacterium]
VQITDLTGKIISTASVNSATNGRLNIAANYAPGVHIITLTSGKNIVSKKISLF